MSNDFVQSLAYTGFTARIKRLSDTLLYDAKNVYKHSPLTIEPNWHLVFLLLKEKEGLSVTEMAKELGFSHPAIIKIVKKMEENNYLISKPSLTDNRKTLFYLSEQSKKELPKLEESWNTIQQIIQEFVSPELLNELIKTENKLKEASLFERYQHKAQHDGK